MMDTILAIILVAVPAIVLHECAHGWVAYRLGDPTAKLLGRLTLNPLKHADLLGTVIVPAALYLVHFLGWTKSLFLFGWAKPVPVKFSRLRHPRRDMILVALAGPAVNILSAFILIQLVNLPFFSRAVDQFLLWGIVLNLWLAFFNLIPVPPLDGSRVVSALLPESLEKGYGALEPFGILIVVVLLNVGAFDFMDGLIYALTHVMGLK